MKLDGRIKKGKKPLTCFDTEEAKEFIGKEGYFSNKKVDFQDLNDACRDVLQDVLDSYDNTPPFKHSNDFCQNLNETYCFVSSVTGYKYFLPSEWVQEKELQSRPYTLQEFVDNVGGVGDVVTYRFHDKNNTSKCEWTSLIMEIEDCPDGESETFPIRIYIGVSEFLLKELFEHYEYRINGQWLPFGVYE